MKGKCYKIVGFVLLVLGLFSTFYWGAKSGCTSSGFLLINLLPGGLWLLIPWIVSNLTKKHSKATWWVGMTGFILALGLALFVNWFVLGLSLATSPVTKVSRYSEVIEKLHSATNHHREELMSHVPRMIPKTATDVHLFYLPSCFQRGTTFQVFYKLPLSELQQIQEKYLPLAKEIIKVPDEWQQKGKRIPFLSFRDKENTQTVPPNELGEFQIMVFHMTDPESWNHGYSSGIAISMSQQEVIYWVDDW
jgi:hypothetical protein